jgi:multiple sugar transport system permease protein
LTNHVVTRGRPADRPSVATGAPRLRARTREAIGFYLCILPWLVGFLMFIAGPMVYSFYLSLTKYDILSTPRWVGLDNFAALLRDDLFWQSLKVTGYYLFGAVPLRLLFGLFLAVLLNQRIVARAFFRTLFYLPAVMSGVAVSLLWLWVCGCGCSILNLASSIIC